MVLDKIDYKAVMNDEDAQVIAQLRLRKIKLIIEMERVDLAIKAFDQIDDLEELDLLPYSMEGVVDNTCDEDEIAIATLLYKPNDTIEKKIQFVLSKLGKGDVKAIAEYLCVIDKDIKDAKKLFDSITFKASRMYRVGKLSIEKYGKKNVYLLKK
jgi:hypothetical protein